MSKRVRKNVIRDFLEFNNTPSIESAVSQKPQVKSWRFGRRRTPKRRRTIKKNDHRENVNKA